MSLFRSLIVITSLSLCTAAPSTAAAAAPPGFGPGPVIPAYGPIAAVPGHEPMPAGVVFKVAFDVSKVSAEGEVSSGLESAVRFLNMQVADGVPEGDVHLAIVVHGPAAKDLLTGTADKPNANAGLIAALAAHGVRIYLCGQTAAAYGIRKDDLLPGVTLALSAMTAHALLQQEGYTLNPF